MSGVIRRSQLIPDRSWSDLHGGLKKLGQSVDVMEDTTTTFITLHPQRVPIKEARARVARLRQRHPQLEAVFRGSSDPEHVALYAYRAAHPNPPFGAFLWLEPHSQLTTWWLINLWRLRQFSSGAHRAFTEDEQLVAAGAARGLLETAATLYGDTLTLADIWARCKQYPPTYNAPVPEAFSDLREFTYEVLGAGRFDTRGRIKEVAEAVSRTNVKTHIQRLEQRGVRGVVEDYDWLCNALHPSVGATFAFAGPLLERSEPYHAVRARFAEHPERAFADEADSVDTTITTAIEHAASTALEVALPVLDDSLRVIDDLGLTTQAPELAGFDYWRRVTEPGRNDPCPCRSGNKAKRCSHQWGEPAPEPSLAVG